MKYSYVLPISLSLLLAAPLWAVEHHAPPAPAQHQPVTPNLEPQAEPVEQSQSVQITALADGKVHVDFSYQDQVNQQQKFSFEGTHAEVQQQIQQLKTLPEPHKQTLLQALNEKPDAVFTSQFGALDPFNDPFFKNDPWMQQMMQQFFQGTPALQMQPPTGQATPRHQHRIPPQSTQKQNPETKSTSPTKVWL
ncbi:hypothetical protein [uncultured Thiothrix sp.]|uniref:hypothetical protein n=1 Tax=uncultured Thiothrix sp. TaxID=223185 RepID=UPI00261ABF7E|nr:hypothetical protein [uncultured Thiothrix sp.]